MSDGPNHNRYYPEAQKSKVYLKGSHLLQLLTATLLILDLLIIYGIFFSQQGILGYRNQSQQVSELEAKILKLKIDNNKLFSRIQGFKNNPDSQERAVREHLGWTRENELVIDFEEKGKDASNPANLPPHLAPK